MAAQEQAPKTDTLKRKKIILSVLVGLVIVIALALIYFLTTGRQPQSVLGVIGLEKPSYVFSIYGEGEKGQLRGPSGVAIDEKREVLYVADRLNRRIVAFDLQGKQLFTFDKVGKGKKFINPIYLAVDNKSQVYVSDTSQGSLFIFDSKGKYKSTFKPKDKKGKAVGLVSLGITFDKDNNLYVADKALHRILKFNSKGKLVLSFGKEKQVEKVMDAPSHFYFPNDVAVNDEGTIYVADSNNHRIQIFNKKGKHQETISVGGSPKGLELSAKSSSPDVYSVNGIDQKVSVHASTGDLQYDFGEGGSDDAQFSFPSDIAVYKQRLYISDTENQRVQVWSF